MQTRFAKTLATAMGMGALIMGSQLAMAQGQPAPQPQPQAPQMEVDDQMVNNFVEAYTDVREIHSEYTERLRDVEDAEKATDLQQEAQAKMEEAVTSNDITVEEYQQIAQQLQADAELRSRVQAELEAATE